MSKKFTERSGMNLYAVNEEVLKEWDETDLFHKSMSEREGCPSYVFFEGPPSANGHPGIHHVMARTIKDVFCRYKTMQGFQVKRKAGWDTHGLPVELGVEKDLGITKEDIGHKISIEDYNAHCRRNVMMFTQEWTDLSHLMGYWVDMEHPYVTYENSYIETLWWLLSRLYAKGLLYKGYTIQPYSPAAGTGLSSHELNQPGCYRDVKDTTVTAQFEILDPREEMKGHGRPVFLAWTTTPWTLPSNTALCVGPHIDYVAVQTFNPYTAEPVTAVLAESRLNAYLKPEGSELEMAFTSGDKVVPYRIVGRYKGEDLVGLHYAQLMPWVKPTEKVDDVAAEFVARYAAVHPEKTFTIGNDTFVEMAEEAFRVIPGDYVTTEDGTGIVHIAPTFGADDAKVAKAAGIPSLFILNHSGETRPMVDLAGKYYLTDECAPAFMEKCVNEEQYARHAGDFVKNAYDPRFNTNGKYDEEAAAKAEDLNIVLCMEMKQEGTAFKIEKHVHNYPHCWRTDKPVLYYPLDSWFIRSTAAKERMMELNKTILWKPESTGTGRFGKWLENLNDWNLSRSRYWGTPLPIWRNAETREEICIGSVEQLYNEIEKSVAAGLMPANPLKENGFVPGDYSKENYHRIDLHRPYVDQIILVSESGQPLTRETDLIDVWFDSGAMPYAQIHYPFEHKEALDNRTVYPADFIAEGVDQTRGWFFTLHAIATMVFDSVAFKAVISNGLVLDKNGQKMSKRLGNAVDPFGAIKTYGSDPVRWYMMTNSSPWDNLKFDPEGVVETSRTFFGKLFQTYSFFSMYANVDGFDPETEAVPTHERPEIDRWILSELNTLIREVTACYEDYEPTKAGRLIQNFTIDNLSNWYVRLNRKRYWAGEMTSDKLSAYQTLYTCLLTLSQLMAPIAPFYADRLYKDLAEGTSCAKAESVHLEHFPIADESLIDTELEARMELAQQTTSLVLSIRKKERIIVRQPLQKIAIPITDTLLKERLESVKQIILDEVNVKEIEFVEGQMLEKKVKCNFRIMGKRFGKMMKAVAAAVETLNQEQIATLEQGSLSLTVEGQTCTIERADVEIISEDMPGWSVANEGALTVALDINITDELRNEGVAREVVKRIQAHRKESGFDITNRIHVVMEHNPIVEKAVNDYKDFICSQVLAESFQFVDKVESATTFDFDGEQVKVSITLDTL
ncbi:isoleucine--tRNA ligase [Alloprevotella sp. Lung230]|uniref:isoleucine--tRNA ligase n=1 Tax=Alloprevotella sp. Lung230 TaxID=2766595 RepID=UPI0016556A6F|nr:isoleucine--tRNA ligase [Alloprevotella sp. Lung230]MBC8625737.1 isoleucine--tRNA ligase [Alloprevotella sp. Lung230]